MKQHPKLALPTDIAQERATQEQIYAQVMMVRNDMAFRIYARAVADKLPSYPCADDFRTLASSSIEAATEFMVEAGMISRVRPEPSPDNIEGMF
jgi:hypothetical protein